MYINTGYEITNIPNPIAAYNTWPYQVNGPARYQSVPVYYIDHLGQTRKWNSWNRPCQMQVPGGMYKGTPTRTGGFYAQNTIPCVSGPTNVFLNRTVPPTNYGGHYN